MNNLQKINIQTRLIIGIILVILIILLIASQRTQNSETTSIPKINDKKEGLSVKQDGFLEHKAKEIYAKKYQIPVDSAFIEVQQVTKYSFSGQHSNDFLIRGKDDRIFEIIYLDDNGQELNFETLTEEDEQARKSEYSNIKPEFAEKLAALPKESKVNIIINIKTPQHDPAPSGYSELSMNCLGSGCPPTFTPQQYNEINKKKIEYDKYLDDLVKNSLEQVSNRIINLGYKATVISKYSLGAFIPASFVKEISKWEEINEISEY